MFKENAIKIPIYAFYVTQTALYAKPIGKKGNPCYSKNKESFLKNSAGPSGKNLNTNFTFQGGNYYEQIIKKDDGNYRNNSHGIHLGNTSFCGCNRQ